MFPCIQPTKIHILFDMYTITLKKNFTENSHPGQPPLNSATTDCATNHTHPPTGAHTMPATSLLLADPYRRL